MFYMNRKINTSFGKKHIIPNISLDSPLWKTAIGRNTGHTCPLLPLSLQAVLSPSALLMHSNVIFFHSLKMFAFFNELSTTVLVFVV